MFSDFGDIEAIDLINDRRTGRNKGFGFIYFKNLDDAVKAKESCTYSRVFVI